MKITLGNIVLSDHTYNDECTVSIGNADSYGYTELTPDEVELLVDLLRLSSVASATVEEHPFAVKRSKFQEEGDTPIYGYRVEIKKADCPLVVYDIPAGLSAVVQCLKAITGREY